MPYRVGTVIGLTVLLLGLGSWGFPADLPTALQVKTYQGIPYVSGGAGEEERDLLHTLGREYNLKLIFAAKAGNYVSEVSITIANGRGQKVLEAVSEGPWFYTKLPPGTYRVMAQVEGRTQQQVIQVNQQKQTQLQFYW
jgi:hypothetical protein